MYFCVSQKVRTLREERDRDEEREREREFVL